MNRQERFKNTPKFNSNEKRDKAFSFCFVFAFSLGFVLVFFNLARVD